jgi:hypothetical protein
MKLIKISAIAGCCLLLMAATKGTEVSQAEISQFQTGTATVTDVEGKLGMPQRSGPTPGGGTAIDYILLDEKANGAAYVPLVRLAAGAMNVHEVRVEFQFDTGGHLTAVSTGQRDMVCPHAACGPEQMSQPWSPSTAQGD